MAIYKTKSFNRWADSAGLKDEELNQAATEVAGGIVEASLGGGVFKKRVALPGKGKSSGSRTLIAFKRGKHMFYLYGFNKSERSNVSKKELRALKSAAEVWFSMSSTELVRAINAGALFEVKQED